MSNDTIARLERLTDTIDRFVNGPATDVITVGSGTLSTLKGIEAFASKSGYMQKVIDYPRASTAIADAASSLLKVGQIARVFGEPARYDNGLFLVQSDKSLRKIDYADLYDLDATRGFNAGNKSVTLSANQLSDSTQCIVMRYAIDKSAVNGFFQTLAGDYYCASSKNTARGLSAGKFRLLFHKQGATLTSKFEYTDTETRLAVDAGYPVLKPSLSAVLVTGATYDEIQIVASWSAFLSNDPARLILNFQHIDKADFM